MYAARLSCHGRNVVTFRIWYSVLIIVQRPYELFSVPFATLTYAPHYPNLHGFTPTIIRSLDELMFQLKIKVYYMQQQLIHYAFLDFVHHFSLQNFQTIRSFIVIL